MRIIILAICLIGVCGSAQAESVQIGNAEIVAQTIAMESASKPEGMSMVAVTLYNRALKRGTSMSEEALRARQYSCWNGGGKLANGWLAKHYTPKVRLRALKALKTGILEAVKYPDLRHYHTIGTRPAWARGKTPAFILGGHKWYRGIK